MTCGLKELLLNGQSQEPAVSLFPQLFSCLTVRLGASVGVSAPKDNNTKHIASVHVAGWESIFVLHWVKYRFGSCIHLFSKDMWGIIVWFDLFCSRVAADALRILLARAQLEEVMKRLDEDNAWDAMKEQNSHITGVTLLARYGQNAHKDWLLEKI